MRKLFDVRSPWFRSVWRRGIVVMLVLAWTAFEFLRGSPMFGILFGAAGAYLYHQFFIVFDPKDYEPKEPDNG